MNEEIIENLVTALSQILDDLSPVIPFSWDPETGVCRDAWDQAIAALEKAGWKNI